MTTNDMTNWPNVAPPGTPIGEIADNGSIVKNLDGAEKPEGFFSQPSNALPDVIAPERDEKGRFLSGNNGGGRKPGARNKFTETFMQTIAEDFAANASSVLAALRASNPEAYMRIIIALLPKAAIERWEQSRGIDYDNVTEEEFIQLLNQLQREKFMRSAVETVNK